MEETYCVYKHTSPSGKVYIGITKQTPNGRWKNGFGYESSPHFWNAIQKYGWDSFEHEVVFDGLSEDHACLLEQDLIEKYKATDRRYGYNQKSGGEKGSQLNDEVRQRMSENKKKYYLEHPEARENISLRVKGFKHSDEARIKMSIAAKNRHYKLTDEWKQKIGDANKKRFMSDLKLYEDAVNRCIQNGMKTANPVIQFDMNGVEIARYKSCKDAGKENGLNGGNISRCCKGRCKTCGGYKWQYANEYNNDREVV